MEEKIRQIVSEMFQTQLQDNLGSFSNMTVPMHRHNGVDSLQVPIDFIIIAPNTGVPFVNGKDKYNIYIEASFGGNSPLVIEPSTQDPADAQLFIGKGGVYDGREFNNVYNCVSGTTASASFEVNADSTDDIGTGSLFNVVPGEISSFVTDGTDDTTALLAPGVQSWTAAASFALRLPDASLPSPQAGMIAFHSGTFYACADGTTWKTISLI